MRDAFERLERIRERLFDDTALGITLRRDGVRLFNGKRGLAVIIDAMRLHVLDEAYAEHAIRQSEEPAKPAKPAKATKPRKKRQ